MLHTKVSKRIKSAGKQKGISLYLSIMVMAIILAIALGIGTILIGQLRTTRGMGDSVIAFFAADQGIETTLYNIRINNFQPSYSDPGSASSGAFEVSLVCGIDYNGCPPGPPPLVKDPNCLAPYFCAKSIGSFKDVKRAIEVLF